MSRRRNLICCWGIWLLAAARVEAAVKPHGLFTDNAVLQQQMKLPVWGTTDQAEIVTVRFEGQEVSATPKDGQWRVELAPLQAGGPFQMSITQGDSRLELNNLLVGEVWVCGGQSNMEMSIQQSAGAKKRRRPPSRQTKYVCLRFLGAALAAPRPMSRASGRRAIRRAWLLFPRSDITSATTWKKRARCRSA